MEGLKWLNKYTGLDNEYKGVVNVKTGYIPRRHQTIMHRGMKRFNFMIWHRRAGKTVGVINEKLDAAMKCKLLNPQYAYIGPSYRMVKRIAWEYLKNYTKKIPGVEVRESDLMVVIHRPAVFDELGKMSREADTIKLMLLGADNPDSIRGIYLDGAIIDEYAQCDPKIWSEVVRPALADRPGWAIIIGTPKGRNHFYKLYEAIKEESTWFTYILKASESGVLPQEELDSMAKEMSHAQYMQEMECSFDAVVEGAYFGDIFENLEKDQPHRFAKDLYIPNLPVETFWDIGVGDYCTIVFRQRVEDGWNYIDYYENNNQGLQHYWDLLRSKTYKYSRHVWPHDGRVKEWGTGLTRFEQATRMGIRNLEIQKRYSIDDGIQAIRTRLQCSWFDKEKCGRLIDCLRNYSHEYDYEKEIWVDKPKHDWTSHATDAFRYSALDDKSSFNLDHRNNLPKQANSGYNEISY